MINRKGSAKRLIWRQILRRISCVMTCAGVTSNRRRLILCRQAKPSAPRKNPSAANLRPRRRRHEQHPIHDEDQEDATPDDYEREMERLDEAVRARSRYMAVEVLLHWRNDVYFAYGANTVVRQ